MWLEDLFVRPPHRGAGVGRALLAAVAARVRERGGERLEWSALDWNELALGFYRGLGAQHDGRMGHPPPDGEALRRLAGEAARIARRTASAGSLPAQAVAAIGPRPRSPMDKTTAS